MKLRTHRLIAFFRGRGRINKHALWPFRHKHNLQLALDRAREHDNWAMMAQLVTIPGDAAPE